MFYSIEQADPGDAWHRDEEGLDIRVVKRNESPADFG
jgi:hypothetical protein